MDIKKNTKISKKSLMDAIGTVCWYNELKDIIKGWKSKEFVISEDGQKYVKIKTSSDSAIQLIYMVCVLHFGDYGVSPRSGWIEDIKGFYAFIDEITKEQ